MTITRKIKHSRSIDMTSGPIFSSIIKFILPLIATNLLHQLYHSADILIVGLSNEPDAVGAIGSTGAFLALIRSLFIGFSVGVNVVVARYIGAKDSKKTSDAVHTAICMSLMFGIFGSAVGIAITRPVLIGMGYEGNLLYLAARYSYIYLACMPFLSLTNFLTAILQAKGDTKTPFYVLTATGALNILLNIFFVLALGMSVEGVAIATAISNVVSAYILWYHLVKHGDECKIHFSHMRIHRFEFIDIFRVGFPSGIQSALFSFSNVIIQSSIVQVNNALTPSGSSYAPVIKGNAAAGDIETFIFSALAAISAASSAFTAQNVGAKNWNRIRMVFVRLSLIGTGIVLLMSALTVLFMDPLFSLYGVNNASDTLSALTYQTAELRIWWKCPALFIYAIMDACAGSIRGLGKSILSAIISIFTTCIFRVVWIYTVFAHFGTLESIYISYPISWLLSLVIFLPLLFALIKRKERAEIKI